MNVYIRGNERWLTLVTRPMTALSAELILYGSERVFRDALGFDHGFGFVFHEEQATVVESEVTKKRVVEYFEDKDESYCKQYLLRARADTRKMLERAYFLKCEYDAHALDAESLIKGVQSSIAQFSPYLVTIFGIEVLLTRKLEDCIKESNTSDRHAAFLVLTNVGQTDTGKEQSSLRSVSTKKQSRQHAQRYGYMGLTNSLNSLPYEADYFWEASKIAQNQTTISSSPAPEIDVSEECRRTAELLKQFMLYRTERIDAFKKAQFVLTSVLHELCEIYEVRYSDITWYKFEELLQLVRTGGTSDVTGRASKYSVISSAGSLSYGEELSKLAENGDVISGRVASPGSAIGTVRLVFAASDLIDFSEGDILVTHMTTPDLLPGMKRAGAIVTDEGGVLCHAAIVSRELDIPCVIGTNIATAMLKNGDKIEVDAEKGIIKRISD